MRFFLSLSLLLMASVAWGSNKKKVYCRASDSPTQNVVEYRGIPQVIPDDDDNLVFVRGTDPQTETQVFLNVAYIPGVPTATEEIYKVDRYSVDLGIFPIGKTILLPHALEDRIGSGSMIVPVSTKVFQFSTYSIGKDTFGGSTERVGLVNHLGVTCTVK